MPFVQWSQPPDNNSSEEINKVKCQRVMMQKAFLLIPHNGSLFEIFHHPGFWCCCFLNVPFKDLVISFTVLINNTSYSPLQKGEGALCKLWFITRLKLYIIDPTCCLLNVGNALRPMAWNASTPAFGTAIGDLQCCYEEALWGYGKVTLKYEAQYRCPILPCDTLLFRRAVWLPPYGCHNGWSPLQGISPNICSLDLIPSPASSHEKLELAGNNRCAQSLWEDSLTSITFLPCNFCLSMRVTKIWNMTFC